jgi:hypothetical protein
MIPEDLVLFFGESFLGNLQKIRYIFFVLPAPNTRCVPRGAVFERVPARVRVFVCALLETCVAGPKNRSQDALAGLGVALAILSKSKALAVHAFLCREYQRFSSIPLHCPFFSFLFFRLLISRRLFSSLRRPLF